MLRRCMFASTSILALGAALALLSTVAIAAPASYTTPNVITTAGATSVTFNGVTFVNQGLQGVARLPATTTLDFNGDTFGAFSSLAIGPNTWRKTASGYTGTLYSLPDRGPNGIGAVSFSDYPGRTSIFSMLFNPYTDAANLPVSANSQHQLALTQTGGFFFKDFNGNVTTGLDPGTGSTAFVTENGLQLPGSTVGAAAGKISLDAEGLRFLNNGNFYVSDEYGANVYYFDSTGHMQGVIQPPAALVPRDALGNLSFTSLTDAVTGRRINQGLEGMAITADNKKLVTLLQSATVQDSNTNQQTRTNTRLMIYDISQNKTPTAPIADYVLQLPVYTANGNGTAVNRTAAQSELLALNDSQFLVLSRDANGLGLANLNPVFKSILLVDTTGATNIAGSAFETSTTPISPGGVLNVSITPVAQTELVNMLNTTQLGKFGLNINNVAPTGLTLTEKLEGMALVPVLEEKAPQDFFLLVGNDNDFLSSTCRVGGQDCSQAVNSDALILSYRLTLPTYVDPGYLQSLMETGPVTASITTGAAHDLTASAAETIDQHLEVSRHTDALVPAQGDATSNLALWAAGNWASLAENSRTPSVQGGGATVGIDANLSGTPALVGAAVGYYWGKSDTNAGFGEDHRALQLSLYGSVRSGGFYGDLSGTYSNLHFSDIVRPAAYGMTASGAANGYGYALSGEIGYLMESGGLRFGPLAGLAWTETTVNGYTETGAAGGNILFPTVTTDGGSARFGAEGSMAVGGLRTILRVTYNTKDNYTDNTVALSLASAQAAMATQTVSLSGMGQSYIEPSLTLTGLDMGPLNWWVAYGAKIGNDDGVQHRVTLGFRMAL